MGIRIAIPTHGEGGLDSLVADRFGRAETITVVEVDENGRIVKVEVHENPGYKAGSGAGVKAAQKLGELRVNVYVGPTPGPNAYAALQYLGIKIVTLTGITVKEAVEEALKQLEELKA
jgi:predicted Fe-Mo cluster-binding NifX family protein